MSMMERDNRKSHLAPQLSPTTQDLLRSSDSPDAVDDDRTLQTPTSGEIPVGAALMSPRDQYSSISSRSPTRNGGPGPSSSSRAGGPPAHPGLGPRVVTTNSIPKITTGRDSPNPSGPVSAKQATFALPLRPPPPGGPLPPPPPVRRNTPDDGASRGSRRQATFGPPGALNTYGLGGYPNQVRRE